MKAKGKGKMEALDLSMLLPNYDCNYNCNEISVEGVRAFEKLLIMSQETCSSKTKNNNKMEEAEEKEERRGGEPVLLPALPNHLGLLCLARLPPNDYATLCCVCHAWRRVLRPSCMGSLRRLLGMQTQSLLLRLSSHAHGYEDNVAHSSWFILDPSFREVHALPGPPLDKYLAKEYHYVVQYEEEEHQVMVLAMDLAYLPPNQMSYPKRLLFQLHLPEGNWSVASTSPSTSPSSPEHPRNLGWRSLRLCHNKLRRQGFAYALLGDFLYFAGGTGPVSSTISGRFKRISATTESSCQRFHVVDRRWESLPNMCRDRINAAGFLMDGRFYVLGGYNAIHPSYNGHTDGEFFDPKMGLWTLVPFMWPWPMQEYYPTGERYRKVPNVVVIGNQLFALKHNASSQVLCYDKLRNIWNSLDIAYVPPSPPPPLDLDQDHRGQEWERREHEYDLVGFADELWLIVSGIPNMGVHVVSSKIELGKFQEWTRVEIKFDTKFTYVKSRTIFNI